MATKIRASTTIHAQWLVIGHGHPQLNEAIEEVVVAEDPSPRLDEEAEHQEAAFLVAKTLTQSRYIVTNVTA